MVMNSVNPDQFGEESGAEILYFTSGQAELVKVNATFAGITLTTSDVEDIRDALQPILANRLSVSPSTDLLIGDTRLMTMEILP